MSDAVVEASLNPEQATAVTHGDGPLLIVAGAGTGKTTVITRRITWLIDDKKAKPEEILALTFTEKAAAEMEDRVDRLLPYGTVDLAISTFHAFGEQILRERGIDAGLDPGFRLLSTAGQWSLIRNNLDRFKLDYYKPLGNPTKFISALLTHFSRLKDEDVSPADYQTYAKNITSAAKTDEEKVEASRVSEAAEAYATYQELLHEANRLDYGDLIIEPLRLFQTRPNVLAEYHRQFKYILVDEFQDTNIAQYDLVKLLAGPAKNLTVVGDDDQSIYKFRGAAVSNILEFKKDFPTAAEVVLTTNYRSTQNILDLAYEFIQLNNPNRLEAHLSPAEVKAKGGQLLKPVSKKLTASTDGLGTIELRRPATELDEVTEVINTIVDLKTADPSLGYSDFAVLVRANDMADRYIDEFSRVGLPYQFVAAKGLFQKPEILDLIAYLRLLDNFHESSAVHRLLTWGFLKIPMKDVAVIGHEAKRRSWPMYEVLREIGNIPVSVRTKKLVPRLLDLLAKHSELARRGSTSEVFYAAVRDTGYLEAMSKIDSSQTAEQALNLNLFYKKIIEFEADHDDKRLPAFMNELKLMVDIGEDPAPPAIDDTFDAVRLMTVHAAKGLEFKYVFIVQLVDQRFPSRQRRDQIEVPAALIKEILTDGEAHLEEERRLFYVAITRAKRGLYLSAAQDYGGVRKKKPSRFLNELNASLVNPTVVSTKQLALQLERRKALPAARGLKHSPATLSYSQIRSFWTCPYQYRFGYVLNVPSRPNSNFSFGNSLHNTLREFYQHVLADKKPTLSDLKTTYEANWIAEWYDSPQHMTERKAKGWEALERLYQENEGRFTKPKFLEKGFSLKLDGITVRGFIDRIDEKADGTWEIIDYKTGQSKTEKDVEKEQLLIYAIAARESLGHDAAELTFYYLEDGKKLTFKPKEEQLAIMKERIVDTAKAIKQSDFKATPGFHCKFCDFREICEFRAA